AVKGGHSVCAPRKLQADHGHTEILTTVAWVFAAQRHQMVVRYSQHVAQWAKVLFDQARVKSIMSRRHGCVRSEHNLLRNARHSLIKTQPLVFHTRTNCLQNRKTAMPFVQMQHAGRDTHGTECAETSNAKEQFLPNSNASIAAVQSRRK